MFKHVESSDENIREKVIHFLKDKVCFLTPYSKLNNNGIGYRLFASKLQFTILCPYQVFPLKAELLKPQEQMERHVTDLVKKVFLVYVF